MRTNIYALCFIFLFGTMAQLSFADQKSVSAKAKQSHTKSIQNESSPRLVIGIVVDQMRFDYIKQFWNLYSENGFKRLVNEGFLCANHHYDYIPTVTGAGHATIATGAYPAQHGIVENDFYLRREKKISNCVQDDSATTIGNTFNSEKASPHLLQSPTFSDRIKTFFNAKSKNYAISLKDRGAILTLGFAGDAAYWLDRKHGNWVSSSFYCSQLPSWLENMNEALPAMQKRYTEWQTLYPLSQYTANTLTYTFNSKIKPNRDFTKPALIKSLNDPDNYFNEIYNSPFGNSMLVDLALALIENENLGQSPTMTDFLGISFSSTDAVGHRYGPNSVELADCYLRLDLDLANLLQFLDKKIGKDQYLIYLTADHGVAEMPEDLSKLNIPAQRYPTKDIDTLVWKFAKTFYPLANGENALEMYYNENLFLNHAFFEKSYITYHAFRDSLEHYLNQNGLQVRVLNTLDMERENSNASFGQVVKNSLHPDRRGEMIILLKPHTIWSSYGRETTHFSPYTYDTHVPLIWFGKNVKQGKSIEKTSPTDIAPTVCSMLQITAPAAAQGKILDIANK